MPDRNLLQLSDRGAPTEAANPESSSLGLDRKVKNTDFGGQATLGLDHLWALNQLLNLSISLSIKKKKVEGGMLGCCDEIVPAKSTWHIVGAQ